MSGPFAGGGFFGSGGKTQVSDTKTETRAATGQSYADHGSQSISGFQLQDNASVTLTDQGAVASAFAVIGDLVKGAYKNSSDATSAAVSAFQSAQEHAGAVNADQLAKWGVVALVLVVSVVAYVGNRK